MTTIGADGDVTGHAGSTADGTAGDVTAGDAPVDDADRTGTADGDLSRADPGRAADRVGPAGGDADAAREEELIPLAGRLALVVGRINRRIRPAGGGLSHGMLSALATVVRRGPIKAGELARLESVSAPTLTRALTELESRGLVTRDVDATDRRSFYVVATEAGTELVLEATSERARMAAHLLAAADSDELKQIERALAALESLAGVTAREAGHSRERG